MAAYTTDDGTQTITFDYKQDATSISFNQILRKLMKPGIYEGGILTRVDDTTVSLSAYTAVIYAYNEDTVAVRVETESAYNVTISAASPYIVLRYEWHSQEANYVQAIAKSESDIASEDSTGELYVIVGKGNFTGSVLSSTFDYAERESVSKDADTILLGEDYSINSAPTGGTSSVFAGDSTYVTAVLTDLYARLIDLSGVQNTAIKQRHVDSSVVHGDFLKMGQATTYKGGSVADSATIADAIQTLSNLYKTAAGIDDDAIKKAHIDFGTGAVQVNLNDMSMGSAVSQAIDGTVTDYTHIATTTLSAVITSLTSILNEVAVIANANTASIGSNTSSIGTNTSGLSTLGGRVTTAEDEIDALQSLSATNASDIDTIENRLTKFLDWPIGSIMMFDGSGWADNSTIPGWYACTEANYNAGRTPNLEGRFIQGAASISTPFADRTTGSNSRTISEANLPSHTHAFAGTSGATTTSEHAGHTHELTASTAEATAEEAGSHTHTWNYNSVRRTGTGSFESDTKLVTGEIAEYGTNSAGEHTHTVPSTTVTGTADTSGQHTHTVAVSISGNTGATGGATAIDIKPANYALIFIRKVSQPT